MIRCIPLKNSALSNACDSYRVLDKSPYRLIGHCISCGKKDMNYDVRKIFVCALTTFLYTSIKYPVA